jgi:fructoselysine-6-P-deglycase FrlB-like protein
MDEPTDLPFDPNAPLPGAPDPWAATDQPARRAGPPYHLTEMIIAEPALAERVLARLADPAGAAARLAAAVAATASAAGPIVVTGCGTSEHGALGAADILRDGLRRAGLPWSPALPIAAQAFELSLEPGAGGLVIGVSHEGGTPATIAAMTAARAAGATVALVTASDRSPAAALADQGLVVETGELDRSWCHTVGYLSPLLAAAAVAAHLAGEPVDGAAARALLAAGVAATAEAESIAAALVDRSRILVMASGTDRTAGRELVLKLEEGTWIPSAYRDLETILHGHWPGTDASTGIVLVLADRAGRERRTERAHQALEAARVIGIRSAAIVAAGVDAAIPADLTPAGRIVVPEEGGLSAPVAALLGTATPLQLVTERLARARGTDPDPIRRDDPVYRGAAEAAEG